MSRKVVEINLKGGIWANVVVPDNATREDEFEVIVHHIRSFKEHAETLRAAVEAIEELAEEDENVKYVLEVEGFKDAMESKAAIYEAMALKLIEYVMKEASVEELLNIIGPSFFGGFAKATMEMIDKIAKEFQKEISDDSSEELEVSS